MDAEKVRDAIKAFVQREIASIRYDLEQTKTAILSKPEIPGPKGEAGKDGKDGRDGRDGRDGADGADGANAWEVTVLQSIDPEQSYARGTCASYKGGLILATRNTSPISGSLEDAGWRVVVEGVAARHGDQIELTSGRIV